jgi:hypothetical protein
MGLIRRESPLVLLNSSDYLQVILAPNSTIVVTLTLELTVTVRALGQAVLDETGVIVRTSAQVIRERRTTIASYITRGPRELGLPLGALLQASLPKLYSCRLPLPNAKYLTRPRRDTRRFYRFGVC